MSGRRLFPQDWLAVARELGFALAFIILVACGFFEIPVKTARNLALKQYFEAQELRARQCVRQRRLFFKSPRREVSPASPRSRRLHQSSRSALNRSRRPFPFISPPKRAKISEPSQRLGLGIARIYRFVVADRARHPLVFLTTLVILFQGVNQLKGAHGVPPPCRDTSKTLDFGAIRVVVWFVFDAD
ncbi:MAG: hypothetical protein V6Z86_06750 [Hyphomicrobiales bacterium]